ncbi:UDP-galactose transporter senju [Brevipalpus obovatus]|uniref:UDP-galactose transporter senju n=1 Tax=Brevipalpus obovatus TaxID=246614 RepID=UPI003D9FB023
MSIAKNAQKNDIFPNNASLITFLLYIALFVLQGILVTASKSSDNGYNYNTIAAVLAAETLKLIISCGLYLVDNSFHQFWSDATQNLKIFSLYMVPAALYCLYNNLAFINLRNFDPTTYFILLQLRVVITGLFYQFIFKRRLTRWHWFSLMILTIGCMVKNWGNIQEKANSHVSIFSSFFHLNLIPMLIQILCSCCAGVYNEYLLKSTGTNLDIMIHNIFMYVGSIICNILALSLFSNFIIPKDLNAKSEINADKSSSLFFQGLLEPFVISVIINNALCGIVTSIFLKKLNSILKTFASALELGFTALLCYAFFSNPIDLYTVISIVIVSYATWLYFKHPIRTESSTPSDWKSNHHPSKFGYTLLKNCDEQRNGASSRIHDV